jgi:hypothetical protein
MHLRVARVAVMVKDLVAVVMVTTRVPAGTTPALVVLAPAVLQAKAAASVPVVLAPAVLQAKAAIRAAVQLVPALMIVVAPVRSGQPVHQC